MEQLLRPGRKIWFTNKVDDMPVHYCGPFDILTLKKILPAGKTETGADRLRSLVQIYTDPGGMRTLAAADIWSKDPSKTDQQW